MSTRLVECAYNFFLFTALFVTQSYVHVYVLVLACVGALQCISTFLRCTFRFCSEKAI